MIRTKILHGKVDILLIDGLPEDAQIVTRPNRLIWYPYGNIYATESVKFPPGNWQPVNWIDKVSEDEAKEFVEIFARVFNGSVAYKSYNKCNEWFWTAKESLLSLVQSEIKIKNILIKPSDGDGVLRGNEGYQEAMKIWEAGEAQVWRNIYLLKKID